MTKQGEIEYLRNIGPDAMRHAIGKPFSDLSCGKLLMEIGAVMTCLPPPPARLLDLGCGTGWTSRFFARRGYQVIGQDIAADMIFYANKCKDRESLANLEFVVSDFEDLNYENEFDGAVFFDSLHHSENDEGAIRLAYRALKKGGICVTSEPGIRHAKRAAAVQAVKTYHVTERDMSPQKILRAGRKAGFTSLCAYPHLSHLGESLYGKRNTGLLRHLFKFNIFRILASFFIIAVYRKFSGIVVMIK